MEQSNANADPESLLAALHAERRTAEEEAKRKVETEEDDALVAQYFAKIPSAKPANGIGVIDLKGKGRAKVPEGAVADADDGAGEGESDDDGSGSGSDTALPALTVKRRPVPGSNGAGEPTVSSLLAARGKVLDNGNGTNGNTASNGTNGPGGPGVKRKREGMQKLLGIKKKAK